MWKHRVTGCDLPLRSAREAPDTRSRHAVGRRGKSGPGQLPVRGGARSADLPLRSAREAPDTHSRHAVGRRGKSGPGQLPLRGGALLARAPRRSHYPS